MKARIIILALCILFPTAYSQAYFVDAEASSLDMSSGRIAFDMSAATTSIAVDDSYGETFTFTVDDSSTHDVAYRFTAVDEVASCGSYTFDGSASTAFDGEHAVTVEGDSDLPCTFTVQTEAWQPEIGYGNGGFTASRTISFALTSVDESAPEESIVLNEVYPHENSASSSPLDREWIELYNTGDEDIDVAGWKISEESGTGNEYVRTIHDVCNDTSFCMELVDASSTTIVSAGGFVVLQFKNASSELNNSGDTVRLYDSGDVLRDEFSYDEDKGEGLSWARIPDGGTWVDPVPTPAGVNSATLSELRDAGFSEEEIAQIPQVHIREEDVQPSTSTINGSDAEVSGAGAAASSTVSTEGPIEDGLVSATTTESVIELSAENTEGSGDLISERANDEVDDEISTTTTEEIDAGSSGGVDDGANDGGQESDAAARVSEEVDGGFDTSPKNTEENDVPNAREVDEVFQRELNNDVLQESDSGGV